VTGLVRVVLIAPADPVRGALATYLRCAGFEVYECDELAVPTRFNAIVAIHAADGSTTVQVSAVRSWLRVTKRQRIVVVSARPSTLHDLVAANGERLFVLPAPAFGWDVVDTLRLQGSRGPHGA
jgi:hypothetical protein